MSPILVSSDWLSENISDPQLVVLDASMTKVVGREPIVYEALSCIPHSKKCCLETAFCDTQVNSVHAFPSKPQFEKMIKKLGIGETSRVIIYDNQGIYSAPRAWWIFKVMGFANVSMLDGGLPKWIAEGRATASQYEQGNDDLSAHGASFLGSHTDNRRLVCDANDVLKSLNDESITVIDARSNARYLGLSPEPRVGLRSGHIPHSVNIPFDSVLDGHCFKHPEVLKKQFPLFDQSDATQLVFSCGSGITACVVLAAARLAGCKNTVLYDGSWADWGSQASLPIE